MDTPNAPVLPPTLMERTVKYSPGAETEIVISQDGCEIVRRELRTGSFTMGQAEDCDIVVTAEGVSRRHATLIIGQGVWHLEDAGSTNGLVIGTQKLTGSTRIWPGQEVRMGTATVRLRRAGGRTAGASSATAGMRSLLENDKLRDRRYAIGASVAEGGMGAILDVRDGAIERRVAMKVMLDPGDPEALARFIAEARITGQLEHPNIVPIHDIGVDDSGQVFYTMKFVRGVTLHEALCQLRGGDAAARKLYPRNALLTIFQKVCDALAFAHSRGVLHRDLKPANIMLGDYGEVLVMD